MNTVAAEQIHAVLSLLPRRPGQVPLFVFDGGYDAVRLALAVADAPAQLLVRIRSDRCFYAAPPPEAADQVGRPRRHGAKFACGDATTCHPLRPPGRSLTRNTAACWCKPGASCTPRPSSTTGTAAAAHGPSCPAP
ncbi:transposase [Nonomuraea wenchangensis]